MRGFGTLFWTVIMLVGLITAALFIYHHTLGK